MSFRPKNYQQDALDRLEEYMRFARVLGPRGAFSRIHDSSDGGMVYREIPNLESVPYICIRIPTGGGKTVVAAYSIPRVSQAYLGQEYPAVIWMVPSRIIREQTLAAMKDPGHPYRAALDDAFGGRVRVFGVDEIRQLRPIDLAESACIFVTTMAASRIEETEDRAFYDHCEDFEPFFQGVPKSEPGLERDKTDRIKYSFANILHLKRPMVIVDEAHNARTALTFESLARISPSAVVEFTATPDKNRRTGSNVIFSVSAIELRDEAMIKLPIVLTEHKTWQEAVYAAIVERDKLAKLSRESRDVVRPITLFQAQTRDEEAGWQALFKHLVEEEGIDEARIAIATGDRRDLEGINLFSPDCPIDFIITVAALREGWDCSFAYVLCSLADVRSSTAVEQVLGRVLRMPFAEKRSEPALNQAYAHVVSPSFVDAAEALQDKLVTKLGFNPEDFAEVISPGELRLFDGKESVAPAFSHHSVDVTVTSRPEVSAAAIESGAVSINEVEGRLIVTVSSTLSDIDRKKILDSVPREERQHTERRLAIRDALFDRESSPSEKGQRLAIPLLAVWVQGELELAERDLFLSHADWNLTQCEATLPSFRFDGDSQTFIYDFAAGPDGKERLKYSVIDNRGEALLLPGIRANWTEPDLVRWLDRQTRDAYTSQEQRIGWLSRLVGHLLNDRHYSISDLCLAKFIIADAVKRRIKDFQQQAVAKGYQQVLFGFGTPSVATEFQFEYEPKAYAPLWYYSGNQKFRNHFYPLVGELKNEGEEFKCAQAIEMQPGVDYWVRNLAGRPSLSFWLPTATDNFYPDFVARLKDGRLFAIEYKGEPYKTNDDSREKNAVGNVWEKSSGGKCLYLMAVERDNEGRNPYQQIREKIEA